MRILNKKSLIELNDKYSDVYNFLVKNDLSSLNLGRHYISDKCFLNLMEYETKYDVVNDFEAHRIYDDVHYVVIGEEKIKWQDISKAQEVSLYNQEGDYQFFKCSCAEECVLNAGDIVIFSPEDVHKPQFAADNERVIRKAVFKIRQD